MTQGISFSVRMGKSGIWFLLLLLLLDSGWAQQSEAPTPPQTDAMTTAIRELQEQVRQLRQAVVELRSEAVQYRTETEELRQQLQGVRGEAATATGPNAEMRSSEAAGQQPGSLEERVASLEDTSQLLNSKIDDEYQTKLEAASKYRIRLSGLVLLNLFSNRGSVDNQDVPAWAIPQNGASPAQTVGATLRQSELGLEVFGPLLAGAKTSGNLQFDFSGGFPDAVNGVNYGLVRLRIASLRMDWRDTSIVAGQDSIFVSPLSPASFASLAEPALAYAGNLWGWIPQVRVERRFDFSDRQRLTLQAGILDNLTGEPPSASFNRGASAGESSGQPGYAARVAWTNRILGMPMTVGTAGYYGRQNWGFGHRVDGWAGMADWEIPLAPRLILAGEFYRGRAVGGLGAAIGRSVLFSGNPGPDTQVLPLDSAGGWSQLKFRATPRLEFNGAFGLDSPFARDLRAFPAPQSYFTPFLAENRGAFVNFIYRPRSDLLFSAEYRHLRTFVIDRGSAPAEHVNLMMGFLF